MNIRQRHTGPGLLAAKPHRCLFLSPLLHLVNYWLSFSCLLLQRPKMDATVIIISSSDSFFEGLKTGKSMCWVYFLGARKTIAALWLPLFLPNQDRLRCSLAKGNVHDCFILVNIHSPRDNGVALFYSTSGSISHGGRKPHVTSLFLTILSVFVMSSSSIRPSNFGLFQDFFLELIFLYTFSPDKLIYVHCLHYALHIINVQIIFSSLNLFSW